MQQRSLLCICNTHYVHSYNGQGVAGLLCSWGWGWWTVHWRKLLYHCYTCTPRILLSSILQASRACTQQVGEVLVERTVAEVAPAVRSNRDQLDLARPAEAMHSMALCLHTSLNQELSMSASAQRAHFRTPTSA